MKDKRFKLWLIAAAGLCSSFAVQGQQPVLEHLYDYLENTSVFETNQEEGRAYFIPEKRLSLNGDWMFFWSDTPEGIPPKFYEAGFNDGKWKRLPVPSNWEMHGYGDKLFRNVHAPFKARPPFVPREYNPTGAYRKTFVLPSDWRGEEVFLRFEKVASASFVWVNGKEVGYNEGAQEPAEYNITPYLRKGKNVVAVFVTKYSDGYYLEGQDYWRLAGIFDDVWLYAAPPIRLFDWQVLTDLDADYRDARLKVNAFVKRYGTDAPAENYVVKALLTDGDGREVACWESRPAAFGSEPFLQIPLETRISNPGKWSSESPVLYRLQLQLFTEGGSLADKASLRIGFKETEIRKGVFYLNGVPLKVHAQNSHMQHPELGHAMDETTIRRDFEILKQFNFNAVRTSHYPPVNKYLELADEYGLFVIDETGDEAHATEFVSRDSSFTEMYRERVRRMVLRDRNHACVLFWSAGNESGEGFNITEVIKEGKKYDPTRSWMYGGNAFAHPAEEIIGPRYPTPAELELQVAIVPDPKDIRPSFMDEYISVAGNGGGGMDDYWRVIYAHPRTMGGAIWDFVSPGLKEKVRLLNDRSPNPAPVHLMGNAQIVSGPKERKDQGKVLDLNGNDQWVEVYRSDKLELNSEGLTLAFDVFPRELVSSCGSFLTKGSHQFGIQQRGKDSLEFYIYTNKDFRLKAPLPKDWENHWHAVTARYDGSRMQLFIDGRRLAEQAASGKLKNLPFPINIGRNAEEHGQETNVYICDAQMDNVRIFPEALEADHLQDRGRAVLWLDFEEETGRGTFFSYGIGARTYGSIWPDRRVQPEMWQMKKTVQPLSFRLMDAESGEVEVWNRNHFTPASFYDNRWQLEADGRVLQEGVLTIDLPPLSKRIIRIPFRKPDIEAGREYRLTLRSLLKADEIWAKAGHEVSWDQLELPWRKTEIEPAAPLAAKAVLRQADGLISVSGEGFSYSFHAADGRLTSIVQDGKELLKAPLKLNVWRAPLANELDSWNSRNAYSLSWQTGYGQQVAAEFYSAGLDTLTYIPLSVEAFEAGGKAFVRVRDFCRTGTSASGNRDQYIRGVQYNGFEEIYEYAIDGRGTLRLKHRIFPSGRMPLWLPRIGLTMTVVKSLDRVNWYGRGPQENYPDRKTGYKVGIFQSSVKDMYEPYLIPQDYGLRTENRWVKLLDGSGKGLSVRMNELFHFNAYPFSTENLTKAVYTYQLQEQDGITFNLDYAASGVGCTARAVFPPYRAYPQGYEREVTISLVR